MEQVSLRDTQYTLQIEEVDKDSVSTPYWETVPPAS